MLAFVFPGQGSQSLGMLSAYAESPIVQKTFALASEVLDYDLWELTQNGPQDKLNQTEYTQPALLVAGIALWKLWQQTKKELPSILAGHSLGEYTALICAESIPFEEGVRLVQARGRCMQAAVPEGMGAMAAILGLNDETVRELCFEASVMNTSIMNDPKTNSTDSRSVVSAANYNSPGQVVIAGEKEAVERAVLLARSKGAKRAILLSVSVPSHCELMKPAALAFEKTLNEITFNRPSIPVIHNADVNQHENGNDIRKVLLAQLYQPVRWVETVQKMQALGVDTILECGPGSVLTSLNKRIEPNLTCSAMTLGETLCP